MKKGWIVWVCAAGLTLSGCGQGVTASMTEEEQQVVAAYAAYALLQNTNNYQPKLVEYETVQETTDTFQSTPSSNGESGNDEQTNENSTDSLSTALGLSEQFTVTYTGYDVADSYPDAETNSFSTNAGEGQKLVVLHFQIQNNGEEAMCNILSNDLKFRIRLDDNNSMPFLLTILMDDLYAFQKTMTAGEIENVVLIFRVPEEQTAAITEIELTISDKETKRIYQLQTQ